MLVYNEKQKTVVMPHGTFQLGGKLRIAVFEHLYRNLDCFVSIDDLAFTCWPDSASLDGVGDWAIQRHIFNIRKLIEPETKPQYLVSKKGIGYKLRSGVGKDQQITRVSRILSLLDQADPQSLDLVLATVDMALSPDLQAGLTGLAELSLDEQKEFLDLFTEIP